ncbi:MAG TPA: toast rack family protein [Bryobacteraceae bacterium]
MSTSRSPFDRDNSELVRVNLDLGGGTMKVAGGTDKLAAADFSYGSAASKPEVHYSSSGGNGSLTIKQSGTTSSTLTHTTKEWDVRLNQQVPMELRISLGGGDAHLNLGSLTLRDLEVQEGAGELDLDLRGAPKTSYQVRVQGGAGEATLHLPSSVGVDAQVSGGIGEVNATGLHKDGSRYVNDALGKSNVTIHVDFQGGVGKINLISE